MIAPNVDDIQAAKDRLIDGAYTAKHKVMLDSEWKELRSAMPGKDNEFFLGYQLGLETARIVMERNGVTIHGVPL